MTWWETEAWRAYERASGDRPRAEELAEATWATQVVDLAADEAALWRGLRKGCRQCVQRADGDLGLTWPFLGPICSASATCRPVHVACMGGLETRPPETWALMDGWLVDGSAAGMMVARRGAPVGYAFFVRHGRWAYYHSGRTLERNLSHALVWKAMRRLKRLGTRWCELGWLEREDDTDKDRAISFFKRGFGGAAMPAADAPKLWEAR